MNHKPETLNALLGDCKTPADVGSLYSQLLQRMINRSLESEMDVHLGYARHTKADADSARPNRRNGVGTKTVKGEFGALEIDTPRDRDGSFEPLLVKKRQTRLAGMEDMSRRGGIRTRYSRSTPKATPRATSNISCRTYTASRFRTIHRQLCRIPMIPHFEPQRIK